MVLTERLRRQVPSLGTLAVFEAAVRTGGFTHAAADLGVTQAAVSRQIRRLETDLGTPLFLRANRRVTLTPAGRTLARAVAEGFSTIADAVDEVSRSAGREALTIGATLAFSHFWLLPRLSAFRALHPSVPIRVVTEDLAGDIGPMGLDVLIRYGTPPFRDAETVLSVGDNVFPVASPVFAAALGVEPQLTQLLDLPLIGSDAPEPSWLSWRRWFQLAGLDRAPKAGALRFGHYTDAVYAAIAGEGVALGWGRLLERPLADGRLVRLGQAAVIPADGYHVLLPAHARKRPAVTAFVAWIGGCFREDG